MPSAFAASASGHQSLIGRVTSWPIASSAASLASMRGWFHFSHRSYSMLGLCGLVVASISVGVDVAVQVEHLGREPALHQR